MDPRLKLEGFAAWQAEMSRTANAAPFFGVDRSIPRALMLDYSRGGWLENRRRWLGYKLYAVVYWLLRGHA